MKKKSSPNVAPLNPVGMYGMIVNDLRKIARCFLFARRGRTKSCSREEESDRIAKRIDLCSIAVDVSVWYGTTIVRLYLATRSRGGFVRYVATIPPYPL